MIHLISREFWILLLYIVYYFLLKQDVQTEKRASVLSATLAVAAIVMDCAVEFLGVMYIPEEFITAYAIIQWFLWGSIQIYVCMYIYKLIVEPKKKIFHIFRQSKWWMKVFFLSLLLLGGVLHILHVIEGERMMEQFRSDMENGTFSFMSVFFMDTSTIYYKILDALYYILIMSCMGCLWLRKRNLIGSRNLPKDQESEE